MFRAPDAPFPTSPAAILTTPEPRFIQTMVRDGFPVQAQLKTASEPRSTRRDCGSVAILGPTAQRRPELPPILGCVNQKLSNQRVHCARGSSGRSWWTYGSQPHKAPK